MLGSLCEQMEPENMARGDQHIKIRSGTGEMVWCVKHLLCKHEDWSLDPQSHISVAAPLQGQLSRQRRWTLPGKLAS